MAGAEANTSAQGLIDAARLAKVITVATDFTNHMDTTPEILGYAGSAAAATARAMLLTVTNTTDTTAFLTTVDNTIATITAGGGAPGTTYTLTTGVDIIPGTSGNDTIIADNTGANAHLSAADQINGGAGTDTLKIYAASGAALENTAFGQLTSVENIYINNGTLTDTKTLDVSGLTGVTSIALDSPVAMPDGKSFTLKTAAGQAVSLTKVVGTAAGATSTFNLDGASDVTLNGVGTDLTLDLTSTGTALKLTTTGAASAITLANTGAALATLRVTGDQDLTLTEGLTTLKTIAASAATGKVSVDTTGINGIDGTLDAAFAFTGGAGADTLKLTQGSLDALTAGSQLNGGTGIDTLYVVGNTKAAADLNFAAADYKAVNAAQGFEILGLASGAGKATSVDASQLTSIKEFAVFGTTNTITKVGTGSILDINAGTAKTTVSGAVGTSDLTINIGSAAASSYITNGALDVTGLTNVTVNANIKAGAVGLTHNLGTLTNSDNSTFTIKGNGNLTVALAAATQTGSKIDGSASTGNLTLMGNSAALNGSKASLGDILIGGSGNDVIQSGANSSTLTGNAGKDNFDLTLAVAGATTPVTTITDFSKGDMIKFGTDFKTTSLVSKVDLSGVAAGKTDQQIAALLEAGTATKGDVAWGVYNGNTYAVEDTGTIKSLDTGDIVVKMIGVLDLSTSTHAVDQVLTFA
jgi:hypothetical protein